MGDRVTHFAQCSLCDPGLCLVYSGCLLSIQMDGASTASCALSGASAGYARATDFPPQDECPCGFYLHRVQCARAVRMPLRHPTQRYKFTCCVSLVGLASVCTVDAGFRQHLKSR